MASVILGLMCFGAKSGPATAFYFVCDRLAGFASRLRISQHREVSGKRLTASSSSSSVAKAWVRNGDNINEEAVDAIANMAVLCQCICRQMLRYNY